MAYSPACFGLMVDPSPQSIGRLPGTPFPRRHKGSLWQLLRSLCVDYISRKTLRPSVRGRRSPVSTPFLSLTPELQYPLGGLEITWDSISRRALEVSLHLQCSEGVATTPFPDFPVDPISASPPEPTQLPRVHLARRGHTHPIDTVNDYTPFPGVRQVFDGVSATTFLRHNERLTVATKE